MQWQFLAAKCTCQALFSPYVWRNASLVTMECLTGPSSWMLLQLVCSSPRSKLSVILHPWTWCEPMWAGRKYRVLRKNSTCANLCLTIDLSLCLCIKLYARSISRVMFKWLHILSLKCFVLLPTWVLQKTSRNRIYILLSCRFIQVPRCKWISVGPWAGFNLEQISHKKSIYVYVVVTWSLAVLFSASYHMNFQ
jgi:hypothetical protein